ncbi:hypothetical protein I7I48_04742 [Histoplasma ohiense]|nr:hypothetical protein I7I48_04742 [Histoplasma ohiense (nom. inval.)]
MTSKKHGITKEKRKKTEKTGTRHCQSIHSEMQQEKKRHVKIFTNLPGSRTEQIYSGFYEAKGTMTRDARGFIWLKVSPPYICLGLEASGGGLAWEQGGHIQQRPGTRILHSSLGSLTSSQYTL